MKYDTAWVQSVQTLQTTLVLLLYHSVDPADSQTDTERGQSVLI